MVENRYSEGKKFGYLVNEKKLSVYLQIQVLSQQQMVNVIFEPQLVLPILVPNMSQKKSRKWCNELHRLVDFAKTQPHAAISAFTHGT